MRKILDMKRTLCGLFLAVFVLPSLCGHAEPPAVQAATVPADKPFLSVTIDYLDMAFYDMIGPKEYYSLDSYESRIRRFAELGFKRINFRTNVLGLTFYKSKYTLQYGEREMWHYNDARGARRLIATLKEYDPLAETIRLGHKYGMEVWAWENISDESGGIFELDRRSVSPEALPYYDKYGSRPPFIDPFFVAHPECWASKKPITFEDFVDAFGHAMSNPVAKIVLKSYRNDRPRTQAQKADFGIFYSFDNKSYVRYEEDFSFECGQDADGYNFFVFNNLNIRAPFVKIASGGRAYSNPQYTFSVAVRGPKTAGEVYNTKGEKLNVTWGYNFPWNRMVQEDGYQLTTPLHFDALPTMGVDTGQYQLGFFAGEVFGHDKASGLVEFCNPVAMRHKLDKFSELAAYPFDGYRLAFNCHTNLAIPDDFSYNPALRERLLAKTGKDIYRDELPLERIIQERGEGFTEYIEGCKRLIGDRPLYLYGWPPGGKEQGLIEHGRSNMGSIVIDYPRLIKKGTVDGVVMYYDFHDYFTPEVTGGRKIDLSFYSCIEIQPQKKLEALPAVATIPGLTEIDVYGAVVIKDNQEFQNYIRAYTGAK